MCTGPSKAHLGQQDLRDQQGRMDHKDRLDPRVHKVRPVRKGQLGRWDCREWEYKGHLDRKDHLALWDHKVLRASPEWKDFKVFKDLKACKVRKGYLGHRAMQELRGETAVCLSN